MPRPDAGDRARRVAALGLAGVAVLALSGCEKPAPGVSVFSGTTTVHREALCWEFEGDQLAPGACAQDIVERALSGAEVGTIPVVPGSTVGISVDPVVADSGWFPVIGDQRLTEQPLTTTYYRFQFPSLNQVPADGLSMQVVAGRDTKTRGIWVFKLTPASG
jgi:hypothetical protein